MSADNRKELPLPAIRRIPVETVAQVFRLATSDEGIPIHYSRSSVPWNIASVCKLWREILFETPELWTCLQVDWHRCLSWNDYTEAFIMRLKDVVGLSGTLPLSLIMEYPFPLYDIPTSRAREPDGSPLRVLEGFLKDVVPRLSGTLDPCLFDYLLIEHTKRIILPKITDLYLPQDSLSTLLERDVQLELPALTSLNLFGHLLSVMDFSTGKTWVPDSLIRSLIFQSQALHEAVWHETSPSLILQFVTFCNGFAGAPHLKAFCLIQLSLQMIEGHNRHPPVPITLPHIRELSFYQPWHQMDEYLTFFRTPSLASISVEINFDTDNIEKRRNREERTCEAIRAFLRRSECQSSLTFLSLWGFKVADMSSLLELCPALLELTVSSLNVLCLTDSSALAPALRKLRVAAASDDAIVAPDIVASVLAMRHPGRRVYSFQSFAETWAFVNVD